MSPSVPLSADQGLDSTSFSTQSAPNGDTINMVFGIFAVLASGITIWQGRKTWKLWREHHSPSHAQAVEPLDLELDGPPPPPHTSPEPPVTTPTPNNTGNGDLPLVSANNEHDNPVPPEPKISESSLAPTASSSTQARREVPLATLEIRSSRPPPPASSEPPVISSLPIILSSNTDGLPHPD